MIGHYVEAHEYLPPQAFLDALSVAPLPGTEEYVAAVASFREHALRSLANLRAPEIRRVPETGRVHGDPSWDRTHDWVVVRTARNLAEVRILFAGPSPSPLELLALRKTLPELANTPLADLRARTALAGEFDLGTLSGIEARKMETTAQSHGLRVQRKSLPCTTCYAFRDRTTNVALLVEDEAKAERIAIEMIEAGAQVETQEVD